MIIEFYKYQGTGNDFIMIDDRENTFDINDQELVAALCERRMGIGADGLILLRKHDKLDFEMIYFNSDGKLSSMCGNGGRCIVAFAKMLDIITNETNFMAIDGAHKAKIAQDGIYLQMQEVTKIEGVGEGIVLDTGSPHYIEMVDSLDNLDVEKEGRKIRNSAPFKKEGINVNFVLDAADLEVRTYERGVEAETLSCGTGVTASALVAAVTYELKSPIQVMTRGGLLTVTFEKLGSENFHKIYLAGPALKVFEGSIDL